MWTQAGRWKINQSDRHTRDFTHSAATNTRAAGSGWGRASRLARYRAAVSAARAGPPRRKKLSASGNILVYKLIHFM
jgi:hypothetical protein